MKSLHISKAGLLLCLSLVLCSCGTPEPSRPALRGDGSVGHGGAADPTIEFKNLRITRENYHGWSNAIAIRNDRAEVVIVPDIGRVMSFGMVNGENVLWNDPALHGKPVNPEAPEWINFGGDKSWPAPEAEWGLYTGRKNWRPPPAFDSAPNDARVEGKDVVLLSPVDPFYGIQVRRRVHLDSKEPKLTITTTYERVSGTPSKIGVWVITQMRDPVAVFIPGPERSIFPDGFYKFGNEPWTNVVASRGLIHVTRDPAKPHKLGSDADQLLWMGAQIMCLVESPRVRGAEYPDRNASAEVYTNPDPKKYVELEMLGPLSLMKPGDKISQENTYTLFP
ncbi:MAG TPA: DUF4380 domain-containing protein, partial [Methylomirabilota bacterium]|nr:DUF4380 domain-containing protein [Methylomirabilota bacterium]